VLLVAEVIDVVGELSDEIVIVSLDKRGVGQGAQRAQQEVASVEACSHDNTIYSNQITRSESVRIRQKATCLT